MIISSPVFKDNGQIHSKYTCDGEDVSPPLSWSEAPNGTKTYVLIMDDPDAPVGVFTHWVIFNIPASENNLSENVPKTDKITNGALQGKNDFGRKGYGGPCPPSGRHRYQFHLYASDTLLNLTPGSSKKNVLKALEGHILAKAELTGLYSRR